MTNKPLYNIWASMKKRCYNPNYHEYHLYGGRGITVCKEWQSYKGFYDDMIAGYEKGLSIDRIDNSKGYSKDNCKWSTAKEQANNTRNIDRAFKVTFDNQTLTIKQWAEKLGIKRTTLGMRIMNYHWPIEEAFSKEVTHH